MISKCEFAKLLMKQNELGIVFKTFMPVAMWIQVLIVWVFGISLSAYMIYQDVSVGMFLMGFFASHIYMTISLKFKSAQYWNYTKEMINWDKVKVIADGESS